MSFDEPGLEQSPSGNHSQRSKLGRIGLIIALGAVLVMGYWIASETALLADKAEAVEPAPAEADVLARIGDRVIRQEEVEEAVSQQLRDLDRQRHQTLEQGLEQAIAEALLDMEAAATGVSVEKLVATEVDGKVPQVTEEEINAFYEQRKAQINQPLEQISGRVRQFLTQQRRQGRYAEFLESLEAKYEPQSFLDPMRIAVDAVGPALGPESAAVTIVEFSDFQCPYCSRIVPTLKQVAENYAEDVRLVFRQFPLHSIHPEAQKAAEASLCASDQDKFWEMHDSMFENQSALAVADLKSQAAELGLDATAFNECLDSGRYAKQVDDDLAAGISAGVSGTPAVFINGRFLSGAQPYEAISAIIDDELRRAGG